MKTKALVLIASLSAMPLWASTVTLQQGLNGYTGCRDVELRHPTINYNDKGPYTDRYWAIEF